MSASVLLESTSETAFPRPSPHVGLEGGPRRDRAPDSLIHSGLPGPDPARHLWQHVWAPCRTETSFGALVYLSQGTVRQDQQIPRKIKYQYGLQPNLQSPRTTLTTQSSHLCTDARVATLRHATDRRWLLEHRRRPRGRLTVATVRSDSRTTWRRPLRKMEVWFSQADLRRLRASRSSRRILVFSAVGGQGIQNPFPAAVLSLCHPEGFSQHVLHWGSVLPRARCRPSSFPGP